jgi:hypothetical protein
MLTLNDKEKEVVFEKLAIKVFNAHAGAESWVYNERNTGCTSKNHNEGTHQGKLNAVTKGNSKKVDINAVKRERN